MSTLTLEHTLEIAKPPQVVFDYLAHHPNHVKFVEQNLTCEQVSPGPMGVGTELKNTAKMFGALGGRIEEHFAVTAFDPPRLLSKASQEGSSFDTTDSFELAPSGDGTRLTMRVTVSTSSLAKRLLMGLMKPVVHGAMKKSTSTLKAILETKA